MSPSQWQQIQTPSRPIEVEALLRTLRPDFISPQANMNASIYELTELHRSFAVQEMSVALSGLSTGLWHLSRFVDDQPEDPDQRFTYCNVIENGPLRSPGSAGSDNVTATTTIFNTADGASAAFNPSSAEPNETPLEDDHLSLLFGPTNTSNDEVGDQQTNSSQDELRPIDVVTAQDLHLLITYSLHTSITQRRHAESQHARARLHSTLHTEKRAFWTTANGELMRQVYDKQIALTELSTRNVAEALGLYVLEVQKLCGVSLAAIMSVSALMGGCPPDVLVSFVIAAQPLW
ncbi:hypothetical protein LTS18_006896 [Coniosporium uncinatum]|uniref:Uncharacterized protein n=1 Tax=Coniosporium uncinatum TaxID=93489 RepID=A0ACC3D353_9PEZI|nr:hypothetical protein LTS18_006896 [Coniosporium uncinatum]